MRAVTSCPMRDGGAFSTVVVERTATLDHVADYRPGRFFERELPAIRLLLAAERDVDLILVDGYVHIDPEGHPGLGAYVHAEFSVPVIGVAKSVFRSATQAIPVRGQALRPLHYALICRWSREGPAKCAAAHRL